MTTSTTHPITGLTRDEHRRFIRAALDSLTGPAVVTTNRGQRIEVEPLIIHTARTSAVLGFSGRFAYDGLASVQAVDGPS